MLENVLIGAYLSILGLLAIYGFHRSQLVFLFFKTREKVPQPKTRYQQDELPIITVQLPLFNERYVCERLIDAVVGFDYPKDKLEIQVLDDSTDDTTEIARKKVFQVAELGYDITLIHRTDRTGYKAGALENGLRTSKGELVAVFDADFQPPPSILMDTVHYFTDKDVGMVQARWDHINRKYSMLTRIQSLMLDGHFVIEHGARQRSGRFFNFNGTAGIWRISTIHDAGGWEHDTLTEDMDLSYRAQLKGWKFFYLPEIIAPAEIPVEMASFKSQQHRWAKGSIQVCKKMLPTILKADVPFKVKMEAFFHLTNNFAYPLMILLALLIMPNLLVRTPARLARGHPHRPAPVHGHDVLHRDVLRGGPQPALRQVVEGRCQGAAAHVVGNRALHQQRQGRLRGRLRPRHPLRAHRQTRRRLQVHQLEEAQVPRQEGHRPVDRAALRRLLRLHHLHRRGGRALGLHPLPAHVPLRLPLRGDVLHLPASVAF